MSSPTSLDPHHLTVHEDFLQRLARSLLADAHEAKDIVQEAFLAALRQQPDVDGSLRPWLSRVVRNQAMLARRKGGRRARREAAAARAEAEPSTADLLAREEARRKVVAAVVELPEAYRQVILLRYMEDLPPRLIARRLHVPVETVRTRIARGRERLRQQLDEEARGKKGAGLVLLAPWLAPGRAAAGVGAVLGLTVLTTKTKLAVGVGIALLIAGLVFWSPWLDDEDDGEDGPAQQEASAEDEDEPPGPKLKGGARPPKEDPAADDSTTAAKPAAPGRLRGRVEAGGGPVDGVRITIWPARPRTAFPNEEALRSPGDALRQLETDAHGRFAVDGLPQGPYVVEARKEGQLPGRALILCGPGAPIGVLTISRAPDKLPPEHAAAFETKVVDAEGEPVEGARVECAYLTGVAPKVGITDAEGRVAFTEIPYARADAGGGWPGQQQDLAYGYVTARKGGLVGTAPYNVWRYIPSHRVGPIVLAEPARLEGVLKGAPAGDGLRVRATRIIGKAGMSAVRGSRTVAATDEVAVGVDGRYRFSSLAPATYYLTLVSERGLRIDRRNEDLGSHVVASAPKVPMPTTPAPPGGWPKTPAKRPHPMHPVKVVLKAGQTATRDLAVIEGVTLRGRVLDGQSRRAVAGMRVTIEFAPGGQMGWRAVTSGGMPADQLGDLWPDGLRNPISWLRAETDAGGRYAVRGLAPEGRYFVRVDPQEGWSFDQRFVDSGEAGSILDVVHEIGRAGSALFKLRSGITYALRRAGDTHDAYAFRPPWSDVGLVRVPGLRPGAWELLSSMGERSRTSSVLTTFEVRAGEETLVDALQTGDCRVQGRVSRRGRPVPGVQVWLPQVKASRTTTDAEGRFAIVFPSNSVFLGLGVSAEPPEPGRPPVFLLLKKRFAPRPPGESTGDEPYFEWEGEIELPDRILKIAVIDETGQGLPNAPIHLGGKREVTEGALMPSSWRGTSGEAGRVTVPGLQADDYDVNCTFPGTGMVVRKRVTLSEHETSLEIRASKPGSVRVRVVDERGEAMANQYVSAMLFDPGIEPEGEGDQRYRNGRELQGAGRTDENGEIVFANLPPGTLVAFLWVKGTAVYTEVLVRPGEERTHDLLVREP